MTISFQVTLDATEPFQLGAFWIVALDYIEQPPPGDFDSWDSFLDSIGVPAEERNSAYVIVDPEGIGPRIFFQQVPEAKAVKNRMHLDVNVSRSSDSGSVRDRIWTHARALEKMGAQILGEFDKRGDYWVTLLDPEGNEFCIQ